ncbi:RNA polymerase sigma factor [Sphingomonas japonica]|uniref:RNA polymerase sigma-70 factor (ECF subfamily) n=1 Tax=Sphingomonas japonica TaxID=511662 RepID=A0ABX0TVY4_9SPHN|nr:RNA polymerase sigma factor [Sphingomonas japonica]NIJ22478.1 RNA polymerase sigma-70 factor (ECF subfamily) [Sphingomonas japonica]
MDSGADPGGLQQVFLANRSRLLRFLAARGAGDAAEDLVQSLWERIASTPGEPIAEPMSYLFRAAENLMRDRHRAGAARGRREEAWHDAANDASVVPGAERVLLSRERLRIAQDTLAQLGPRAETIFRRYRLDGVGQAAIARELGVSLSTVEKDLQRAYRALHALKERFDAE